LKPLLSEPRTVALSHIVLKRARLHLNDVAGEDHQLQRMRGVAVGDEEIDLIQF